MTVYNVTNITQLNNAWTSADTDGDLIFIKQGLYNYASRVPTPSQVNGLHRNIQVIGYKDSYNASNATSDLDDIDAAWGSGNTVSNFVNYSDSNFPMIRGSDASTTQPLIRLGPGWTARNLWLNRSGSGTTDVNKPTIRISPGFSDQTYINCRIQHNGSRTADCPVEIEGASANFYSCMIRQSNISINGSFPKIISINGGYVSLINCFIVANNTNRVAVRIITTGGNVFVYKCIFHRTVIGVSNRTTSGPNNYLYMNGSSGFNMLYLISNIANVSGNRAYYAINNIAADSGRAYHSTVSTSRPLVRINTRKIQLTNSSDVNFSSRDKDIFSISGGNVNDEFINYSGSWDAAGSTLYNLHLRPTAQSVGKLTFNDNIGALPTEPRQFFSGSNNKSIRHGH